MPVEFLNDKQRQRYGRYVEEPTSVQLAQYFHLDDSDHQFVQGRRGAHNRLGLALQLGTVRFLGTFLNDPTDVPISVVVYVAQQLEIVDLACLSHYQQRRTRWNHITAICQEYGYQVFSQQPEHWQLTRWVYRRAWFSDESLSILFDPRV